jgi:hypothetical protein
MNSVGLFNQYKYLTLLFHQIEPHLKIFGQFPAKYFQSLGSYCTYIGRFRCCDFNYSNLLLNGTHRLLVYADVTLLGDNIDTTKKNRQTLIDDIKEHGLEVNTERTKYILLSRYQSSGQNHDMKIGNRCFQNVAQFRHLGVTVTNQSLNQEEIKRRLNCSNVCCHSV